MPRLLIEPRPYSLIRVQNWRTPLLPCAAFLLFLSLSQPATSATHHHHVVLPLRCSGHRLREPSPVALVDREACKVIHFEEFKDEQEKRGCVSEEHKGREDLDLFWFMVVREGWWSVRVVAADAEARRWRCGGSAVVARCSIFRRVFALLLQMRRREDGGVVVLQWWRAAAFSGEEDGREVVAPWCAGWMRVGGGAKQDGDGHGGSG